MPTNIAVVLGHPDSGSLCGAMAHRRQGRAVGRCHRPRDQHGVVLSGNKSPTPWVDATDT